MADYQADGVSDEYRAKELRWKRAADEVHGIINLLRSTMEGNDGTAAAAGQKARHGCREHRLTPGVGI